jgi:alkylation response protein AidB-like acyl-CoA dehydrogenase
MADFGGQSDLDGFRAEARAWLEANFPPSLKGKSALVHTEGVPEDRADLKLWHQRIVERGWGCPTWPAEYGGGGLTPAQGRVLNQEMGRVGAFNPLSTGMGISMVGPTILDYGTEQQKQDHIPPICRGEIRWCLGYSEPGAGSDLAALTTKAEDAGDHWKINGSKIWTSGANISQWCGVLVRTDPNAKKHDGISFLLVDMNQPGITTRPIKLIAGASPFCETFFNDARAEKYNMLGELNNGWTVGKRLLMHERTSQTGDGPQSAVAAPFQDLAKKYVGLDADGRLADRDIRTRLTSHLMHARAHTLTVERVAAETRGASGPNPAANILKNSATGVAQTRAELTLELQGLQGLGWEGDDFTKAELDGTRAWLSGKAMSIYGGSFEVQNNIISKRTLGLPDMTKSS